MAWDWEKGCEADDPYKFGQGLYTPPNWGWVSPKIVQEWDQAEAQLRNFVKWASPQTKRNMEEIAVFAWRKVEMGMVWNDVTQNADLRREYLEWLGRKIKGEVEHQDPPEVDESSLPLMARIIHAGFRALSKTEHPDLGGSADKFKALMDSKRQLDALLKEVEDIL